MEFQKFFETERTLVVDFSIGHGKTQRYQLDAQTKSKSNKYTWKK